MEGNKERGKRPRGAVDGYDEINERGKEDAVVVTKILQAFEKLAVTLGERENHPGFTSLWPIATERVLDAEDRLTFSASYRRVLEGDFQNWVWQLKYGEDLKQCIRSVLSEET
jgi:hypothetical protein